MNEFERAQSTPFFRRLMADYERLAAPLSGTPLPLPAELWVQERLRTALDQAQRKTGEDRDGWIEDARYWRLIVERFLQPTHEPKVICKTCVQEYTVGEKHNCPGLQPTQPPGPAPTLQSVLIEAELLSEAEKFITGYANSSESGFIRQRKAREWLRKYAAARAVPTKEDGQ